MKKPLIAVIILGIFGAGFVLIKSAIDAPAKKAALNLAAINGLEVGKTTEVELLTRKEFQTVERSCLKSMCSYHTETDNTLLNTLHLAPRTQMSTWVRVQDGLVTHVTVYITTAGLQAISMKQVSQLPPDCRSNPCAERMTIPRKNLLGASIVFSSESDIRNHIPDAVNSACLSRVHGCNTYAELMPISKDLDLKPAGR